MPKEYIAFLLVCQQYTWCCTVCSLLRCFICLQPFSMLWQVSCCALVFTEVANLLYVTELRCKPLFPCCWTPGSFLLHQTSWGAYCTPQSYLPAVLPGPCSLTPPPFTVPWPQPQPQRHNFSVGASNSSPNCRVYKQPNCLLSTYLRQALLSAIYAFYFIE